MAEITIKSVEGNPININVVMNEILHHLSDGVMETETVDFYPDTTKPVRAYLDSVTARRQYCPSVAVSGNTVYLSANNVTAGVYTLTIICTDTNGKARRFKSEPCIEIYDITRAAEVAEEFDSEQYTINGVFYTFMTQADWAEENPVSPAYIWHKPDLSVYATDEELQAVEDEIPNVPEWAMQPQKPTYTAAEVGAVPTTRKVNGKALSEDITLNAQDVGAQTPIADLAQIREGAAKGATAYQKPSTGIAKSDLTNGIQQSLDMADTAYQKPSAGIPKTDLAQEIQQRLDIPIDDEPTAGSNNLVKSGGVYNELVLGAVYDVSSKNPTAGPNNDGKWESLSALLSDANLYTIIPTSVRKGGMSIKFVQSSDNKYVQWRYMGTAVTGTPNPFLDTDNWQGIDTEPIAGSRNFVESGGVFEKISGLGVSFSKNINFEQAYLNYTLDAPIPSGSIIQSFNGFTGRFIYKESAGGTFVSVSSSDCPYTLVKDAVIVRSDTVGNASFTIASQREFYKFSDVDDIPVKDSAKLLTSGKLYDFLGRQFSIISPRGGISVVEYGVPGVYPSLTIKAGVFYIFAKGYKKDIIFESDTTYNFSATSALVFDTTSETILVRGINDLLITDLILMGYDNTSKRFMPNSALFPQFLRNMIESDKTELLIGIASVNNKIERGSEVLNDYTLDIVSAAYYNLPDAPLTAGKYLFNASNGTGTITAYRLVAIRSGGNIDLITYEASTGKIGDDIEYELTNDILTGMTALRFITTADYVTTAGRISMAIKSLPYSLVQDVNGLKVEVSDLKEDVEEIERYTPDIIFPVPSDIFCAVGRDMNLYYENMFGMILGSGYMFIDSPNVVYDTSAAESGSYDAFCNFERQLHFKPNTEGEMTLYLNVWNEYMKQIASKTTTLHIVDPAEVNGKTINMLVNGSSSIDMGYFQSEIKKLLEDNGATVNMVGRWASGSNAAATPYNSKVSNRLSENRSGGSSQLYVTKANGTTTKIVHPTSLTDSFFDYSSELVDANDNHWMVWGNSTDFVELVLKSGNIANIPASGTMTKVAGSGPATLAYDSLITTVPQTTNPFWDDNLNGISFSTYCQNWNRPTPNVLLTLWGTNDIGGSAGDIATGKQWATDAQIATFVARQKTLVDAFTRDCPSGVIIMCPQPTGSSATGKKNSDRNGMLYSKLKATQALMDAFADYSNVIIVPVLWWFDRYYSYNIYERTLSERMDDYYGNTKLDKVSDDTTHPQARGYYQMADAAFSAIVGWVDANE